MDVFVTGTTKIAKECACKCRVLPSHFAMLYQVSITEILRAMVSRSLVFDLKTKLTPLSSFIHMSACLDRKS